MFFLPVESEKNNNLTPSCINFCLWMKLNLILKLFSLFSGSRENVTHRHPVRLDKRYRQIPTGPQTPNIQCNFGRWKIFGIFWQRADLSDTRPPVSRAHILYQGAGGGLYRRRRSDSASDPRDPAPRGHPRLSYGSGGDWDGPGVVDRTDSQVRLQDQGALGRAHLR